MKKIFIQALFICLTQFLAAQTLQSVAPSSGNQGSVALSVIITGSNTTFQQASATDVVFQQGNTYLYGYNTNIIDNHHISAQIDIPYSAPTGYYSLNVYSGAGYPTLNNAFLVNQGPPVSMTITPDTVCSGQFLEVVISGENTNFTQGSSTSFEIQTGNGTTIAYASQNNVISSTSAVASFNLNAVPPGLYDVVGYNYIDNTIVSTNQLFVQAAKVTSIDTNQSLRNVTLNVTITGQCTNFQSATSTSVWLQQNAVMIQDNNVIANNDGQITVNFTLPNSSPVGYYDVNVSDDIDGSMSLPNGFQILAGVGISVIQPADIKVFPNPASGYLYIQSDKVVLWAFSLADIDGNVVYEKTNPRQNERLDVSELAAGVYILRATDLSGNSIYKKIAIQ